MKRLCVGLVPFIALVLVCCNINVGKEVHQEITYETNYTDYAVVTPDGEETGYSKDDEGNVLEVDTVSVTDADYAIAIDDIVVSYMYSKVYLEILVRNVGVERISNIRFLCKLTYPGEYTYAEYLFREGIASGHLNTESDSEYSSEMPQTIEILQVTLNGTMLMDLSSPYIIVP